MKSEKFELNELSEILKLIAPGTILREGIENILRARTGALIVLADTAEVVNLIDGGFLINKEFTPASLYELAKMDGAILLSKDTKRIVYANAMLIPEPGIQTNETGTKHKAAERFAIQTGEIVISISQRRNVITLFQKNKRYLVRDTSVVLARANQAIQTLRNTKSVLDRILNNLSVLEFENIATLEDVINVIQRTEVVMRISHEVEMYICELGNEGRLVNMQLNELVDNIEKTVHY